MSVLHGHVGRGDMLELLVIHHRQTLAPPHDLTLTVSLCHDGGREGDGEGTDMLARLGLLVIHQKPIPEPPPHDVTAPDF